MQGQGGGPGEAFHVAEQKKARDNGPKDPLLHSEPLSFASFIRMVVDPLSQVFARSPLAQLRVRTKHGSVTLAKGASVPARPAAPMEADETPRASHARSVPPARIYNGEAGRTYDTINAEVVGIFRDIAEPPTAGDRLEAGRLLGHIEALRLRNEVRCPVDCALIAQVVVDGQPVDFGEPLFVVDSGGTGLLRPEESGEAASDAEPVEPPRL